MGDCFLAKIKAFKDAGLSDADAISKAVQIQFSADFAVAKALIAEFRVEKRGDKWCVVHCHGPNKGEAIKCFDSKEKANDMHQAIQASKAQHAGFGSDGRPPSDWWDSCVAKIKESNPDYSEEQVNATCGSLWYKKGMHKDMG